MLSPTTQDGELASSTCSAAPSTRRAATCASTPRSDRSTARHSADRACAGSSLMAAKKLAADERAALVLLAVGIVLVFAEAIVGAVPEVRDFVGFTFPSRAVWRDTILGGDLSTWNPLAALGISRLASPLHGTFYFGHLP